MPGSWYLHMHIIYRIAREKVPSPLISHRTLYISKSHYRAAHSGLSCALNDLICVSYNRVNNSIWQMVFRTCRIWSDRVANTNRCSFDGCRIITVNARFMNMNCQYQTPLNYPIILFFSYCIMKYFIFFSAIILIWKRIFSDVFS